MECVGDRVRERDGGYVHVVQEGSREGRRAVRYEDMTTSRSDSTLEGGGEESAGQGG